MAALPWPFGGAHGWLRSLGLLGGEPKCKSNWLENESPLVMLHFLSGGRLTQVCYWGGGHVMSEAGSSSSTGSIHVSGYIAVLETLLSARGGCGEEIIHFARTPSLATLTVAAANARHRS
jgi:hypothetical protein